jgi:MoaA/NifB/PqqE/SkfB family radical SAM enzyme
VLRKLYLELTSRCNLGCSMCYRRTWSDEEADLDPTLYESVKAQVLRPGGPGTVVLGGIGEPGVSPLFLDAVEAFGAGAGRELVVTTNGVGLCDRSVAALARRASLVMVSIDGLERGYRRIRGAELGEAVEAISRINAERASLGLPGSNVGIQFVLSRDNAHDAIGVLDLAAGLRAKLVVISHLLPQTAEQDALVMHGRVAPPDGKELFAGLSSQAMRRGLSLVLPRLELKTERRCAFVEDGAAVITATGAVAPCYRLAHAYPEYVHGRGKDVLSHAFGDAAGTPLAEVWESPAYRRFRDSVYSNRYPSCMDCDLVDGCDLARDTSADCHSGSPSCADCPWTRGFTLCP